MVRCAWTDVSRDLLDDLQPKALADDLLVLPVHRASHGTLAVFKPANGRMANERTARAEAARLLHHMNNHYQ